MDSIEKLKNLFSKFPTVGHRTAARFVYYLAKLPKEKAEEISKAIIDLKNKIKLCEFCFNPFEGENNLCPICQNSLRNKNLLCIVEKEADLATIENTKKYNGLYFILGGTVALMRKEDAQTLRLKELEKRISANNFFEIIIALNPTPEGKATSVLVERVLKEISYSGKITHLAKGIPVGGELEYADQETLESAFEGRK
jgi:recombination protein RecR